MGSLQASMLEAFQSLQEELTTKKQAEVDQTSASASNPGPSTSADNLDLPPPRPRPTSHTEEMDVDYGPALPPYLGSDLHNASDLNSNASEEPSKKVSDRPKNTLTITVDMRLNRGPPRINTHDESDEPRISSAKPKKHTDKSRHKVTSRYVSSSSEEDQSSATRYRSSKPTGAPSD